MPIVLSGQLILVFICSLMITMVQAVPMTTEQIAQCFHLAYPDTVKADNTSNNYILVNNRQVPLAVNHSATPYLRLLNNASLGDQISQRYPLDFPTPARNEDPGRLRNQEFFKAMYGSNESSIQQNLTTITWQPSGKKIRFNRMNGAAQALVAVGGELALNPALRRYAAKTAGTFNYRVIQGTNRLSAHAFGVAIDFALPEKLGTYWQWQGCREGRICAYPQILRRDAQLQEMVAIFEKHGFIWGGKWYHYDSVHFEYRPELLHPACRQLSTHE